MAPTTNDAEVDGEVLAQHVWAIDVPHWLQYKHDLGKQVEFTALVKIYTDRDGVISYSLTNADDLTFLHSPPALAIPDSSAVENPPQQGSKRSRRMRGPDRSPGE